MNKLDKNQFNELVNLISTDKDIDINYLYEVYSLTLEGLDELKESQIFGMLDEINHIELIEYILGEYLYSVEHRNEKEIEEFKNNENIANSIASVVADKYISLTKFIHQEEKMANKYLPPISSLTTYVNFMLNIVQTYQKHDPQTTLIADLLMKSLSIMSCSLNLLINGYETEAFSTWRTLHECECTLIVLSKYQDVAIDRYLKHLRYGLVFKNMFDDKDEQQKVFDEMKAEMRGYDLKSKDIKKYIEYGWMLSINEFNLTDFKLNFRDGLEKLAGLSRYSNVYEMSSEIIHSTPLLIYSNKTYFYYMTLLNVYESFFRLEQVFLSLFVSRVGREQMERYNQMKSVYYAQLVNILKREAQNFKVFRQKTK